MKVITGNRVPIKMWLTDIENTALEQAIDLASLPFAFKHVALMPDAHAGLGMPIGGVLATKGVIVPNAVGVDIGCGMCAVKTSINAKRIHRSTIEKIIAKIYEAIPVNFDHHDKPQDEALMPQGFDIEAMPMMKNLYKSALLQIGTLGGGNHFIELQRAASDNAMWIMIHSGSRNIGKKIADQYGKIAKHWNELWYSETLPGLEFLPIESQYAKDYFNEMKYCVAFALANRQLMMSRICDIIHKQVRSATFEPMINIAHNYAAWEHHFNKDVIVHRKGATRAYKGEIGIIPGSMGSHSFIVEGLGNPESFMSCSHGAGRVMGRKEAIRKLSLQDEINFTNRQGIVHPIIEQRQLDEAPSAYKDIDIVMQNQADLVRPIETLYPIAVVKG